MSETLSCLLKHWTDKDDDSLFCSAFEGDYGSLELPFNVEEFCRDMDKAIEQVKRDQAEKFQGVVYTMLQESISEDEMTELLSSIREQVNG
jgi:hypothetical protein